MINFSSCTKPTGDRNFTENQSLMKKNSNRSFKEKHYTRLHFPRLYSLARVVWLRLKNTAARKVIFIRRVSPLLLYSSLFALVAISNAEPASILTRFDFISGENRNITF